MSEPQDRVILPEDLQQPAPGIATPAGEQSGTHIEIDPLNATSTEDTASGAEKTEEPEKEEEGEETAAVPPSETNSLELLADTALDVLTRNSSGSVGPSTSYERYTGSQAYQKRCRLLDMGIKVPCYDSDSGISSYRGSSSCRSCGQSVLPVQDAMSRRLSGGGLLRARQFLEARQAGLERQIMAQLHGLPVSQPIADTASAQPPQAQPQTEIQPQPQPQPEIQPQQQQPQPQQQQPQPPPPQNNLSIRGFLHFLTANRLFEFVASLVILFGISYLWMDLFNKLVDKPKPKPKFPSWEWFKGN